jgi:hypothetical protein
MRIPSGRYSSGWGTETRFRIGSVLAHPDQRRSLGHPVPFAVFSLRDVKDEPASGRRIGIRNAHATPPPANQISDRVRREPEL